MPLEVNTTVNQSADKVASLPFMDYILKNPVWLALGIVCLIMVINAIVFRKAVDSGLSILVLRAGFWSFLVVTAAIFLNNRVLGYETTEKVGTSQFERIFDYSGAGNDSPRPRDAVIINQIPTINMAGL